MGYYSYLSNVPDDEGDINLTKLWALFTRRETRQLEKDIKEFLRKNVTGGKEVKAHVSYFSIFLPRTSRSIYGLSPLRQFREKGRDGKTLAVIGVRAKGFEKEDGTYEHTSLNQLRFYDPELAGNSAYVMDKNIAQEFLNFARSLEYVRSRGTRGSHTHGTAGCSGMPAL